MASAATNARSRRTPRARAAISVVALLAFLATGACTGNGGHASSTTTAASVTITFPTTVPSIGSASYSVTDAVTCVSASWCVAASQDVSDTQGVSASTDTVASYDGREWKAMPGGTAPSGAVITAISCATESYCVAVGGDAGTAVSMVWSGSSWVTVANPAEGSATLLAVDCPTVGSCQAVGNDSRGALTETLLGDRWIIDANDYQAGRTGPGTVLTGVSCPSPGTCYAVGNRPEPPGNLPIAVGLSSGNWKAMPTPPLVVTIPSPGGSLDDIACKSVGSCLAFGSRGALTLSETLSGGRWRSGPSESPAFPALYTTFRVACNGATCFAGAADIAGNPAPLLLAGSGSGWSIVAGAALAPYVAGEILDVACGSANSCLAVGWRTRHGTNPGVPLVESWDGSRWTLAPTPPLPSS